MPINITNYPWIKVDHINGFLTCTICHEIEQVSPISGLEGIIDAARPFARAHKHPGDGSARRL